MKTHALSVAAFCGSLLFAGIAVARPTEQAPEITNLETEVDVVGDVDGSTPAPSKVLQDTVWIADWNFDSGGMCVDTGWVKWDNRILNVHNDAEFWHIDNRFAGQGGVSGSAAILSKHDLCWVQDGYGNNNDFSIILKYSGAGATLSFDWLHDSEPANDFVTVETDSLGLSEARTNLNLNPFALPENYRDVLLTDDGLDMGSHVGPIGLTNHGPGTHEAYIRFESDNAGSDEDGKSLTLFQAGLVVDNIVVTGGTSYGENFEAVLNPNVQLVESALATGLSGAPWWRSMPHLTDNDKCTENITCAWIDTDPTLPFFLPSMNFGPGQAVIRNWLDDILATPWVSLANPPGASGTILTFRIFPGNVFADGNIALGWRVRAKVKVDNTDSAAPGDSIDCVSPWGHASNFLALDTFAWVTVLANMTAFFTTAGTEVQVSFRVSDWQHLDGGSAPIVLNPGPGPYIDRVRIGRRVLGGPTINEGIDSRTQGNDAFSTRLEPSITPGEHYVPNDAVDGSARFGTCAFSEGTELGISVGGPRHITGDSIQLEQVIARAGFTVSSVRLYAAIVSGPHAGKAPSPYVGAQPNDPNAFFFVNADSVRSSSGVVIPNRWFVDFDDSYFRGGDVLKYVWVASDGLISSNPVNLTAVPTSVAAAEQMTSGLFEVNYLPVINWDIDPPGAEVSYADAVAADAGPGDLDPTPAQLAAVQGADNNGQRNCILYYQHQNSRRRSGDLNRTSFMFSMDDLGYRGDYDVYDVQGGGNSVNQLGSRATPQQCTAYALIIQDDGRTNLLPSTPNGENMDGSQIRQADWYHTYLTSGASSLTGSATVWLISENGAFVHRNQMGPFFSTDLGLTSLVDNQGLTISPNVRGVASNIWEDGTSTSFIGDEFALQGGCPVFRAYDMASSAAGSTITHRYALGATTSTGGAVIMNRDAGLDWNTIWQGFAWQDIRFAGAPTNPTPARVLLSKVLARTVPSSCLSADPVTGNGDPDPIVDAPAVTLLHPNVPNPFNPATRIAFDLAAAGRVQLRIYDVAGKLVRTLVDEHRAAGRYTETWTGLDTGGARIASGVYFYRLDASGFSATRKMVLLQ